MPGVRSGLWLARPLTFMVVDRIVHGSSRRLWCWLTVLTWISAPLPAGGQELPFLSGSVHVLELQADRAARGVAVFPAVFSQGRPTEILNPRGFHLHMTNASDPGTELVYPAGKAFAPPPGRFRIWLEGEGMITPFTDLVGFGAQPRELRVLTMPVVPAGRVVVADDVSRSAGLELRLLYAGGDSATPAPRHELTRRRLVGKVGEGVPMPEGKVFAALWDRRQERYVALSRPFTVASGETVAAPLRRPAPNAAHLLAYVDRPDGAPSTALRGVVLTATQQGQERRADLTVTTAWGVYGVWYGLQPGPAAIGGANEELYLEPRPLTLVGGRVTRVEGTLSKQLFVTPG